MSLSVVTAHPEDTSLPFRHMSPFPSLVIRPLDSYGQGGNMIGTGNAFVLGVSRCIVFKFPPTYHFLPDFNKIMAKYRTGLCDNGGKAISTKHGPGASPNKMARRHRKSRMDRNESIMLAIRHERDEIAAKLRVRSCLHISSTTHERPRTLVSATDAVQSPEPNQGGTLPASNF